jgi:hypothetical protein
MDTEERKDLREKVNSCKGIAWDNCHKIYILMTDEEVEKMRGYGYTSLILASDLTPNLLYSVVLHWYKIACPLKFIEAVFEGEEFYRVVAQR